MTRRVLALAALLGVTCTPRAPVDPGGAGIDLTVRYAERLRIDLLRVTILVDREAALFGTLPEPGHALGPKESTAEILLPDTLVGIDVALRVDGLSRGVVVGSEQTAVELVRDRRVPLVMTLGLPAQRSDGLVHRTAEECDDGNLEDGDGCDAQMRIEPGWRCTGEPSVCTPIVLEPDAGPLHDDAGVDAGTDPRDDAGLDAGPFDEDGGLDGGSGEDDAGDADAGDADAGLDAGIDAGIDAGGDAGVDAGPSDEDAGLDAGPGPTDGGADAGAPDTCGDGTRDPGEECDDNNREESDGCSAACRWEAIVPEREPNSKTPVTKTQGQPVYGQPGNDFDATRAMGVFTRTVRILGEVRPDGDEDIFIVRNDGGAPALVRFETFRPSRSPCGSETDTVLYIRGATGLSLAGNDDKDSNDWCSRVFRTLDPGETVYVHVLETYDRNVIGAYELEIVFP